MRAIASLPNLQALLPDGGTPADVAASNERPAPRPPRLTLPPGALRQADSDRQPSPAPDRPLLASARESGTAGSPRPTSTTTQSLTPARQAANKRRQTSPTAQLTKQRDLWDPDLGKLIEDFERLMSDFEQQLDELLPEAVLLSTPYSAVDGVNMEARTCRLLKRASELLPYEGPLQYHLHPSKRFSLSSTGGTSPASCSSHRDTDPLRNKDFELSRVPLMKVSLLHVAAYCHSDQATHYIEQMLQAGVDVNVPAYFEAAEEASWGARPLGSVQTLHLAVYAGNEPVIRALLHHRASIEARATMDAIPDYTPVHLAVALAQRKPTLKAFIGMASRGQTLAASSSMSPCTAPNAACRRHILALLLEESPDLEALDGSGTSVRELQRGHDIGKTHNHTHNACHLEPESEIHPGMRVKLIDHLERHQALCEATIRMNHGRHLTTMSDLIGHELSVIAEPRNGMVQCEPIDHGLHSAPLLLPRALLIVQGYRRFGELLHTLRRLDLQSSATLKHPYHRTTSWLPQRATSAFNMDRDSAPPPDEAMRRRLRKSFTDVGGHGLSSGTTGSASPVRAAQLLQGQANVVLDMPLPPRSSYKRKRIRKGCLLHFVVDRAIRHAQDSSKPIARDLRLVLELQADVNARAHYNGQHGACCSVTALHLAAAGGSLLSVQLLLEMKASIEAMAIVEGLPHHTPLADAVLEGHLKVCELLLQERANPNAPGSTGKTPLHLAVRHNRPEEVELLVQARANVVLKTSRLRGSPEEPGAKDRGLTPLQFCDRAHRPYEPETRGKIMALLAPSFNGVGSLFNDLPKMGANSNVAVMLLRQALDKDQPGQARALARLKSEAVEGVIAGKLKPPTSYIASLLESCPDAGVMLLRDILLDVPDQENSHNGPLPHRANLRRRERNSQFWWRRIGWSNVPVLCEYQPDTNADRADQPLPHHIDPNRPCWLYDGTKEDGAEPSWHSDLAPKAGDEEELVADIQTATFNYVDGDCDVMVKVLLLANVLDVRILKALACTSSLEIFAEMVIQAILACTYDKIALVGIQVNCLLEVVLFLLYLLWSSAGSDDWMRARLSWTVTAATALKELVCGCWWFRSHVGQGWQSLHFFVGYTPLFRIIRIQLLWLLVWRTAWGYNLDAHNAFQIHHEEAADSSVGFGRSYARGLLGANICIQGAQFIFLLRGASAEAEFGRHILSIIHSFIQLWAIIVVMLFVFAAFCSAFLVMESRLSWVDLLVLVYRGLILGDGEGIDAMQGTDGNGHPRPLDMVLTLTSTFVFTVCLLNVSIAVFTTEYDKARKESYLHFWRYRARLCTQVLLSPRWPWSTEAEQSPCKERRWMARHLSWAARMLQDRLSPEARRGCEWLPLEPEQAEGIDEAEALTPYIGLVGWIAFWSSFGLALLLLLFWRIHAAPAAVCLGISLVILQALCGRCEFAGSEVATGRKFFLWMCHRADFDPNFFISKEVEKEQIDDLRNRLARMEASLARVEKGPEAPAAPDGLEEPPLLQAVTTLVQQLGDQVTHEVASLGSRLGALENKIVILDQRVMQQQDCIDMMNGAP